MQRREFLRIGAAGAAAGAVGVAAPSSGAEPGVKRYVSLGRTDMRISDVSLGSSRLSDPEVVRRALDLGVNYFDTAESYRSGRAESAFGVGLRGARDRVYIASKTRARTGERVHDMMRALEGSLRRLRTDYVDVYFNHAVNDVDRMRHAEWHEFTELARQQGKIRYRGMSGHGSHLVECLEYSVDNALVDVVLVSYNFAQDPDFYDRLRHTFHYVALQPELPRTLEKARARGVGVVAMKTLMGARLNDMRAYETAGATFAQAALRWVLDGELADAAVLTMTSAGEVEEYLGASGGGFAAARDLPLLERYARLQGPQYCQQGCGACESSCPVGVPVSEVLRTRMYAVDYGDRELAVTDYAALGAPASVCLDCTAIPCLGACPNGLPVAEMTRQAARMLG